MLKVVVGEPFEDFGEVSKIVILVLCDFIDEFVEDPAADYIIIKRENLIGFHNKRRFPDSVLALKFKLLNYSFNYKSVFYIPSL